MKKVLCVVDSYEWALANRARSLKKYYPQHKFTIKHFNDLSKINFDSFDVVYSLNWPIHGYIHNKLRPKTNRKYRLVTSVSSHIGQPVDASFASLLRQYDSVSLSNAILYREFRKKFPVINLCYTPFGVDHMVFRPKTDPSEYSRVFGWVGNDSRKVKRVKIIKRIFKDLDPTLRLEIVNQGSGLSREQMADFYNKVGTVICFSESEGTPNPILEAAACGRSIISTKVGNIPELVEGSKTIQVINNAAELRKAILRNSKSPNVLRGEGDFLRKRVEEYWSWEKRSKAFKNFLRL